MKKMNWVATAFVLMLAVTLVVSCKHGEVVAENCDETNISAAGGDDSHHKGENCMSCHTPGGGDEIGEGCFSAAGTIYDNENGDQTLDAGIIRLYTQPDGGGELRATIQVDSKGNFYTTDVIDFSGGVYPSATGTSGEEFFMADKITAGQCNSCHGVSTDALWAQ